MIRERKLQIPLSREEEKMLDYVLENTIIAENRANLMRILLKQEYSTMMEFRDDKQS